MSGKFDLKSPYVVLGSRSSPLSREIASVLVSGTVYLVKYQGGQCNRLIKIENLETEGSESSVLKSKMECTVGFCS